MVAPLDHPLDKIVDYLLSDLNERQLGMTIQNCSPEQSPYLEIM